jgi:hypothetical protein
MRKLESGGDGEGQGYGGNGVPKKPERSLEIASRSPAKRFYIWTALTAFSFLSHILFLFLIDPLKVFSLAKAHAYAYSGIPLVLGLVCLLFTILSFRRITPRTEIHYAVLIVAIIFGSLTIQGIAGIVRFFAKGSLAQALFGN